MKPMVYIETSVISYLTARPSRDLIVAAHQQITHEWWNTRLGEYEPVVSQLVWDEVGQGDAAAAAKRLEMLRGLQMLPASQRAQQFTTQLLEAGVVPPKAAADAGHIATAVVNGADYLVTWNCAHIANGETLRRLGAACRAEGWQPAIILTPEQLLKGQPDVERSDR